MVDNYGISIILMTILIRIIILPLYSMQIKSSEQMMLVQPKVKEIQTKYRDTPEKMQGKLQELYDEHNIKPAMEETKMSEIITLPSGIKYEICDPCGNNRNTESDKTFNFIQET